MFFNHLRAELYRLARSKVFWACAVINALVAVDIAAAQLVVTSAGLRAPVPGTPLDLTPSSTDGYPLALLVTAVCLIHLAQTEKRGGAEKSLAHGRRWRLDHAFVYAVLLVGVSLAFTLGQLIFMALTGAVLGASLEIASAGAFALGLGGMTLLAVGYAAFPLCITLGLGMDGLGMAFGVCWSLGLIDASIAGGLSLLVSYVPAAAPACTALIDLLPATIAGLLKYPANLLGAPALIAQALLVPLGWALASTALTAIALRRRALA